jgi:hypothetical protein
VSNSDTLLDWLRLFRIARSLIQQVNSNRLIIDHWTLGGGTAMMLQIDHRESRDVDIFLTDPQLLPFLDPQKHDFQFETQPDGCSGDGIRSLKIAFAGIGEIDFIVAGAMTTSPTIQTDVDGLPVLLETIPEIITRKVYYRNANITPRDIFDIAAAGEEYADSLIKELRLYRDSATRALTAIETLNPDFVNNVIGDLVIRERYKEVAQKAIEKSKTILRAV